MLVFEESLGENQSTQRKASGSKDENQQQTQPTYDNRDRELYPGHIGGRRVLSSLCHPCSPSREESRDLYGNSTNSF